MPSKFASGKHAIAECDRCGQRYKLKELKKQTIKTKLYNIKVCPSCWDPDHPQLQLGLYPVNDPQAVREPRPDVSYYQSGNSGVLTNPSAGTSIAGYGTPEGGSRVFQWGWAPVGGASLFDTVLTPNDLIGLSAVGSVTITTT
jgi:hypothetical protein